VAALDDLLADGYWPGSATLVAGPSGVGKTLMGLHFIFNGAKAGQPGLIASLQENRVQLERVVRGFGWTLNTPGVSLLAKSPVDMYIDEWVYDLLAEVERNGCRRIFIDSLVDLALAADDDRRFREWMFSLTQRCSRAGISLMMTMELPELFAVTRISENGMSHLVCRASDALRMRVSMSAIGSLMVMGLPARLGDAGDLTRQRQTAEADATQREPADEGPRPAAQLAAVVLLRFEPGRPVRFDDQRCLGHCGLASCVRFSPRTGCLSTRRRINQSKVF